MPEEPLEELLVLLEKTLVTDDVRSIVTEIMKRDPKKGRELSAKLEELDYPSLW